MAAHDDHIVADANAKLAEIDGHRADRHELAGRVAAQRAAAAELLNRSRDAVARNHFAEAIMQSMRRNH